MKTRTMLIGALAVLVLAPSCSIGVWPKPRTAGKHGPPPHAPAYGWRRKHVYRYYPSVHVYFDIERELYFYMDGGSWQTGASLPADIHIDLGQAVVLSLDTAEPYVQFGKHKSKYPPGKLKKQGRALGRG